MWAWHQGGKIETQNVLYLRRFQDLCNAFGFKPVWLTNYEMINDNRYVDFITNVELTKTGEIGMHLHAWNSPPLSTLPFDNDAPPYLIEYPNSVMEQKIAFLTKLIFEKTGIRPTSHRAGRWATNAYYFSLLRKYGYTVDCSVTPHVDWSSIVGQTKGSMGTNYTDCSETPYFIEEGLLEVPLTIKHTHRFYSPDKFSPKLLMRNALKSLIGYNSWLRPNGHNLKQMIDVVNSFDKGESDYIMFMIHSSELMPSGSPTFADEMAVEKLYSDMQALFSFIAKKYEGITLRDYSLLWTQRA